MWAHESTHSPERQAMPRWQSTPAHGSSTQVPSRHMLPSGQPTSAQLPQRPVSFSSQRVDRLAHVRLVGRHDSILCTVISAPGLNGADAVEGLELRRDVQSLCLEHQHHDGGGGKLGKPRVGPQLAI